MNEDISKQMSVLRQRFKVRCAERGAALARACEVADLDAVRGLAHDIAGSAGLFGFPALSEEAQRLSATCRLGSNKEAFGAALMLSASLVELSARGE